MKQIEPNIYASFYKAVTHFLRSNRRFGWFLLDRTDIRTYEGASKKYTVVEDNIFCKYSVAHSAFKVIVKYSAMSS